MAQIIQPWQVLLAALAGWINRHQQTAIDSLREENRILIEQLGERRVRFTDDQRRRLAVAGNAVGRTALLDLAVEQIRKRGHLPVIELQRAA